MEDGIKATGGATEGRHPIGEPVVKPKGSTKHRNRESVSTEPRNETESKVTRGRRGKGRSSWTISSGGVSFLPDVGEHE